MRYSEVYKNIDKRTIQATKDLIKGGIWKDISIQEKLQLCEIWIEQVSEIYGVPTPEVEFDPSENEYQRSGGGRYYRNDQKMVLYKKMSLTTFLHEFRHHMQSTSEVQMYRGHHEEDARAWSLSVYRLTAPKSYENAVSKGILHFI